jgi:hypothetical protein
MIAVAVAAMGCKEPNDDGGENPDPALNGSWFLTTSSSTNPFFTFNNGAFVQSLPSKGFYTTSKGSITLTTTHVQGLFIQANNRENTDYPLNKLTNFVETKWYSQDELNTAGIIVFDFIFELTTYSYKVEGNTLTLNPASDSPGIFTR